jgi:leader peptidase (prepilin peptidase)/N-methyltransferase
VVPSPDQYQIGDLAEATIRRCRVGRTSCVKVTAVSVAVPSAVLVTGLVAGLVGLAVGHLVNRMAGRFPWPTAERSWRRRSDMPTSDGGRPPELHDRGGAVRPAVVELATGVLFAFVAVRFGLSWELPAFLFLAAAGVLLTLIDGQHRLLPDRVLLPSIGIGAGLLSVAALGTGMGAALLRAGLGAVVLFAVFLVLALISPRSLGMGDVKLAALLGLYLGWLGWGALVIGAAAGFVVQAVVALVLLATRRIGLRGELPFGPAMLLGAALVIGWSDTILG